MLYYVYNGLVNNSLDLAVVFGGDSKRGGGKV